MPRVRNSNPCDGCTLRRVKCEAGRPCFECKARGIECTVLRKRQKRGPKGGPRTKTRQKVEEFQRSIRDAQARGHDQNLVRCSTPAVADAPVNENGIGIGIGIANDSDIVDRTGEDENDWLPTIDTPQQSEAAHASQSPPSSTSQSTFKLPLEEYRRFIELYRKRAFMVWPVISCDDLLSKLSADPNDYESYALAASLCAALIAQLRLPEHTKGRHTTSSLQFATDCLRMRDLYDYRESYSLSSVLIPFFLHVYYANASKLRTAGFFIREAITYVHALELGRPETYSHLERREQSLRLRLYWLLLVSERTFSAQHGLPAILQVIDGMPDLEDDSGDPHVMQAFLSLTKLFAYLDSNFTDVSSKQTVDRQKLVLYQAALCRDSHDHASNEAQRVDLFVTRQWVRLLMWEYTARHFAMACYPEDQAFSLFLPVKIGHEMLSLFSLVTDSAIKAHGYGMELKVFRLADAMLDIMACAPWSARGDGMLVGSGEILYSLQCVLLAVGGQQSTFLRKMQQRMSQMELLTTGSWPYLMVPSSPEEEQSIAGASTSSPGSSISNDGIPLGPRVLELGDG